MTEGIKALPDPPFGFGAFTFPEQQGSATLFADDVASLKPHLEALGVAGRTQVTVLYLNANTYDFTNEGVYTIRAQNVTIRATPGARVVLKNFGLVLPPDFVDNILIQDLIFRSDGTRETAKDAIDLTAVAIAKDAVPVSVQRTDKQAHVQITHCSFDGYFDICVDSRSYAGAPQLRVTIDHCLFFDANPGQPTTTVPPDGHLAFTNRGAINFGSLEDPNNVGGPQLVGNALVTVADNVFVNVWRRCPRIATGNFGHIYNNFIYQWGLGSAPPGEKADGTSSWRCIEIGGGDGVVGGGTDGAALIQANRFIPWVEKADIANAVEINTDTLVELSGNEFDKPDGTLSGMNFPAGVTLTDRHGIDSSGITLPDAAGWKAIIQQSGPRGGRVDGTPEDVARTAAKRALP